MKNLIRRGGAVLVLVTGVVLVGAGCGQRDNKVKDKGPSDKSAQATDKKGNDHSDWWCEEHGIPEEMCSACNDKVAKEFKAKGDWCAKHGRAQSQCFFCNPQFREKYAAMYRAKYDKEPPEIEELTSKGDD